MKINLFRNIWFCLIENAVGAPPCYFRNRFYVALIFQPLVFIWEIFSKFGPVFLKFVAFFKNLQKIFISILTGLTRLTGLFATTAAAARTGFFAAAAGARLLSTATSPSAPYISYSAISTFIWVLATQNHRHCSNKTSNSILIHIRYFVKKNLYLSSQTELTDGYNNGEE